MNKFSSDNIRNVCLIGHGGNGKTSVAEAMLYISKGIDRLGKTADGTTCCDYDPEETKRGFSISTAIAPITYNDKKIKQLVSQKKLFKIDKGLYSNSEDVTIYELLSKKYNNAYR